MELIDTHCHLTFPQLREQGQSLFSRAAAANVGRMITVGADPQDAVAARQLAAEHPEVYFTAGVHPNYCAEFDLDLLPSLEPLLADERALAVGETGLDYHYQYAPRKKQQMVFEAQINLAQRLQLPLVIHCRDAYDDCLAMLDAAQPRLRDVVFHCFTGDSQQSAAILERDYLISFTGIVTFSNAKDLQSVAKSVPDNRLLLETDAPYLSPVPVRKIKINEPSHLLHTAKFLAGLRDTSLSKLAKLTCENAERFFRLKEVASSG